MEDFWKLTLWAVLRATQLTAYRPEIVSCKQVEDGRASYAWGGVRRRQLRVPPTTLPGWS